VVELSGEQRRDPTTGAWCIVAPERGARPVVLAAPRRLSMPASQCPFCPGHEGYTMPTLAELPGEHGWSVRAFANKYPALRVEGQPWSRSEGPHGRQDGVGAHEVVVESPLHDTPLWGLSGQQERALRVAQMRMRDLWNDVRIQHLLWFRNRGVMAGASQPHPHAQILGGTAVPLLVDTLARRSVAHADGAGRTLVGAVADWEREQRVRFLGRFGDVEAFCAYAPRFAFETWLVPVERGPTFRGVDRLAGLAAALDTVLRALADLLDDPDHNVVLYEAPRGREAGFCWHVRISPRMVAPAGFEIGGGGSIVHTSPEEAASLLREAMR
jgi:UDPglucose--hexose-1-phosphate uridylyltransferase